MNTITNVATDAVAKAVRRQGAKQARKAGVTKAAAEKPAVTVSFADSVLAGYGNMKAWPKAAGEAPSWLHLITARGLLGTKSANSKRELAVAAYFKADAQTVNTQFVAAALMAVKGGSLNPLLNVVNRDLVTTLHYCKVVKVKANGGTAYQLSLTPAGIKRVERFVAVAGITDVSVTAEGVTAAAKPAKAVKPKAEPVTAAEVPADEPAAVTEAVETAPVTEVSNTPASE